MPARPNRPHKLALYRAAVQHPEAEVRLIERLHARGRDPGTALLLREDFAGTAAVASAWVASDPDRQAVAVDRHGPTARWAARHAKAQLGRRAPDLHVVHADVMDMGGPRVDAVAALNFSICQWHDPPSLDRYLRWARRRLRPGGVFLADIFGGPGAMRPGTQRRTVHPDAGAACDAVPPAFDYLWEQRAYDAATSRIDCRIHFELPGSVVLRDAFRYRWRLWSPVELVEAVQRAGFADAELWCDTYNPAIGQSDGRYRPLRTLPIREDFVAYAVGRVG